MAKHIIPSWSYSSLKLYENCPYRYYRERVKKDLKTEWRSDASSFGELAHRKLEQRMAKGRPLAGPEFEPFEKWCRELEAEGGRILTEYKMALNTKLQPVDWFARDAWGRAAADVIVLSDDERKATVVDWKTGAKHRYDELQGLVLALHMMAWFPKVKEIRTRFIFLKPGTEDGDVYHVDKDANYIWNEIFDRLKDIATSTRTDTWPKRPTGLCGWCNVEDCRHWRPRS